MVEQQYDSTRDDWREVVKNTKGCTDPNCAICTAPGLRFSSGIEFPITRDMAADRDIDLRPPSIREFGTGARRDADADVTRYDLIPPAAEEALAATYAEGAVKYGDHNYLKGMPYSSTINHAKRHINLWMRGDRTEDHLAHAAWGLLAIVAFEAEGRGAELNDLYPWK